MVSNRHKCKQKAGFGKGPLALCLLLYVPHNHHHARMDKQFRLLWGLAITEKNCKRGRDSFLTIHFIRLSRSIIKAPENISPFTAVLLKAHSSSQSCSLELRFAHQSCISKNISTYRLGNIISTQWACLNWGLAPFSEGLFPQGCVVQFRLTSHWGATMAIRWIWILQVHWPSESGFIWDLSTWASCGQVFLFFWVSKR